MGSNVSRGGCARAIKEQALLETRLSAEIIDMGETVSETEWDNLCDKHTARVIWFGQRDALRRLEKVEGTTNGTATQTEAKT